MKKYLGSFLSLLLVYDAFAKHVYYYNESVDVFPDNDITVNPGVEISQSGAGYIQTKAIGPTYLHNNGSINGIIDAGGNNLFVYNTGTINGITTVNGGNVIQVVNSQDKITHIDVFGNNYRVNMSDVDNVDLGLINSMGANAFYIKDSSIVVNNFSDLQNWDKNVVLQGPVCLIINDIPAETSEIVIDDIVEGRNYLIVKLKDSDGLHALTPISQGQDLVYRFSRTTDYVLIDKSYGGALEQIRRNNPNDKLIIALDRAHSADEINNVKNNSYRYNHNILLRPVKVINGFMLSDVISENNGVTLKPLYVFSNTVKDFGVNLNVGHIFNNLYLKFGLNFNDFSYTDDINDFYGLSYGLNIGAKYKISDFWIDGIAGIALTKYKADYITKEDTLETNPLGVSGYGKVSFGYDFHLLSDLVLAPFAGASYEKYSVADIDDSDTNIIGGGNIKYSFDIDGIKYEYSVMGSVTNNEDIYASVDVGFVSMSDAIGASVGASIFKNEYDCYYKLSLNAKVLF